MSWRINDPSTLVSRWGLQGDGRDDMGRYNAKSVNNMVGWPASGPLRQTCGELNGNNSNINLGDITQLNKASAFTLCGWMNQRMIDVLDYLFFKYVDATHRVSTHTDGGGWMYMHIYGASGNGAGYIDYSTVIAAGMWHHVAWVFDGLQAANASRLVLYVDGVPVVLTFSGTIPPTTEDLSATDAYMGDTSLAFDGRLWDWRLYNVPVSRDEIVEIIRAPVPFAA